MLRITQAEKNKALKPLDTVTITGAKSGDLLVRDGAGRVYFRAAAKPSVSFQVGGALGTHTVVLENQAGKTIDATSFRVECVTEISDAGGRYAKLLDMLRWTMIGWNGEASTLRYQGKFYYFFVRWLRDHVHALKGMKYFYPKLKSGIDLYADSQRDDGMIWDNIYPRGKHKGMWDNRFEYGDFIRPIPEEGFEFKRIPVENDVEYLFLEGLYYTWKATGDTAWMTERLDNAIRAVQYSTSDEYRWSRKFKLLKRGYTIDTWDFQGTEDAALFKSDAMCVHPEKSRFGVMHGDNTGMAVGCQYLAEMLTSAGRKSEAKKYQKLGKDILTQLNKISWNGKFFTHHVPEDGKTRDFGVDEKSQVSLSNAYDLNRGITHQQAAKIIKTYQDIRRTMPKSSPGEWYQIYPTFPKGFGGHGGEWEYMNGGVTTIVAGELAHGAFEHGFENYGVDILDRLSKLGARDDGYFHCCYRGAMPKLPKRKFTPINLAAIANADFKGKTKKGVLGWTDEGDNDLHEMTGGKKTFHDIPFTVIDPKKNDRRACLGLSNREGFLTSATLPVGRKAKSIYFLQTMGGGPLAGAVTLKYQDGSEFTDYIRNGKIGNWWTPQDDALGSKTNPHCRVAWRGKNKHCCNVGVFQYGLNNPHPEKKIASLVFEATKDGTRWMVLGVTLCDKEVFFMPSHISYGIPDNWGAAAVVYALIEGLAGVKDTGVAYDRALLAPRWHAAGVKKARAAITYPASGGYVSYRYVLDTKKKTLNILATSSGETIDVELLLPNAKSPTGITINRKPVTFRMKTVEKSTYACFSITGIEPHRINVSLG